MMWGFLLHCAGCLADIQAGANDLETVSDHTYASSPRYKTEDEAYWAGVAKAMERDALHVQRLLYSDTEIFATLVETYSR